jgi:hypothetical protein
MNSGWSDDWVFTGGRFDLLYGPDEPFLKFLAETVHPVVRPGTAECEKMIAEYNAPLAADGWEMHAVLRAPLADRAYTRSGSRIKIIASAITKVAKLEATTAGI